MRKPQAVSLGNELLGAGTAIVKDVSDHDQQEAQLGMVGGETNFTHANLSEVVTELGPAGLLRSAAVEKKREGYPGIRVGWVGCVSDWPFVLPLL